MENFNRLEFKDHVNFPAGFATIAKLESDNGYGVSVVTGESAYTDEEHPYELAVLKGGRLCYSTPVTDDVLGHLTAEDVDRLMGEVEALPQAED